MALKTSTVLGRQHPENFGITPKGNPSPLEVTPHPHGPWQPSICCPSQWLCLADTSHVSRIGQHLSSCSQLPSLTEHVSEMHPCRGVCQRFSPFFNSWIDVRIHQLIFGFLARHRPMLNTCMTVLCGPKCVTADLTVSEGRRLEAAALGLDVAWPLRMVLGGGCFLHLSP